MYASCAFSTISIDHFVQVTHGFPQNPSPLFHSTLFHIENRPGLEDQRVEQVMSTLAHLGAPDIQDCRHAKPGEAYKRIELAKWLSDWHLIAFLGTTQLFSPVSVWSTYFIEAYL